MEAECDGLGNTTATGVGVGDGAAVAEAADCSASLESFATGTVASDVHAAASVTITATDMLPTTLLIEAAELA